MSSKKLAGSINSYIEKNVGYIVLDNPSKLNAISFSMWEKIGTTLEEYKKNKDIRCVVMTGNGEKAFSAGADISEFNDNRSLEEAVLLYDNVSKTTLNILQNFPKPTIAIINGYCIGGGLATALSCDVRIASEKSTFAIPAAKLGLAYDYLGIKKLRDLIGPSRAKYIFFTARQFSSTEAIQMGIIEQIFKEKDFKEGVMQVLNTIIGNAPLTIASAKLAIDADIEDKDLEQKYDSVVELFTGEDFIEGPLAFSEKRKPVFKGH